MWYTVEFIGLGLGGTQMSVLINGESVQISNSEFPAINFDNFNGPLYVGGHPSISTIGVSIYLFYLIHDLFVMFVLGAY